MRMRKPGSWIVDPAEASQNERNPEQPSKYGLAMQILRTLFLVTWFYGCSVCILATQLIGSPLYFISKNYYNAYMALTKEAFGILIISITQWCAPTKVRVSGDASVQGQLKLTKDGLRTMFPDRVVLIANHQVYTDWLYLWWVTYTAEMHGHIFIVLKEALKYIPVLGQGMMFYGFIFMSRKWRSDKPRLQHHLEKLKSQPSGPKSGSQLLDPMWLLIFPEGTNLSVNTKKVSDAYGEKQGVHPLKHQILPRSTGLFFCLQQLRGTVDWLYDCTIAYEGPPKGSHPDQYFTLRSTYLQGHPPESVNIYWRRFPLSEIPLDNHENFSAWLIARWAEKDQLLERFFETGRFPSDLQASISPNDGPQLDQKRGAYIETSIRLAHWIEVGKIFIVLMGVALLFLLTRPWGVHDSGLGKVLGTILK